MRRLRVAACAALAVASSAAAADTTAAADAASASPLRVAMSGTYWPLHDEEPDGERAGLEADLARYLAQTLGQRVAFVGRKQIRSGAIEAVAEGRADIAFASVSPGEKSRVDFTRPYLVLRYRLAGRAEPGAPEATADTAGKRIAAARGGAAEEARRLFKDATVVPSTSVDQAVGLVKRGLADLVFGEDVGLVLAIAGTNVRVVGAPIGEAPLALAVRKGEGPRYDQALEKLSTTIAELVDRYRPGVPVEIPTEVYLAVKAEQGVDETGLRIGLKNLEIEKTAPRGAVEWYGMPAALPFQISAPPMRDGTGVPVALRRRLQGEIHDRADTLWVKLPDGTFLLFEKWRRRQQCGAFDASGKQVSSELLPCMQEGYNVLVVRGEAMTTASITTLLERT